MPRGKGKHLTLGNREVIEAGIRAGDSARGIAARIGASPSTVSREVRANRTVKRRRSPKRPQVACARYRGCDEVGTACGGCGSSLVRCRDCRTRDCTASCPSFELRMCPETEGWPHVCPEGCPRRPRCSYPKCSYSAAEAHESYLERLSSSRSGADLTDEQLAGLDAAVSPLVRAGHSFGSIAASHPELGVCARTLYNYQAAGLLSTTALDLPRKARVRPRKKAKAPSGRERVDRSGRRYEDFLALPDAERALVCEADSVEGRAGGARDLLSLMPVARKFQLYLLKAHGDPAATVSALDRLERAVGSREGFALAFGLILADRGVEFDDWAGMERSCLEEGGRRCRVFYCDAQATNQKSRCERNHEQLRRVLPKGASDLDALTDADVGLACSHVNSYPLESMGGLCGFDLLGPLVPWASLAELGVARVPCDEVVLRPSLIPHAHVPRSAG